MQLAETAEEAGWEALLLWDHLAWVWDGPAVDPWVTLGAVAVRTERLLLGTCVTPVPRRRPQVLALQVATLDELSGGRAVLGAGLGGNRKEFEEFGESFDRERRWELLEEGLTSSASSGPARSARARSRSGSAATAACASPRRPLRRLAPRLDDARRDDDDARRRSRRDAEGDRRHGLLGGRASTTLHDAYAPAGTTWWLEHLHDRRGSLDELLARVAAGP